MARLLEWQEMAWARVVHGQSLYAIDRLVTGFASQTRIHQTVGTLRAPSCNVIVAIQPDGAQSISRLDRCILIVQFWCDTKVVNPRGRYECLCLRCTLHTCPCQLRSFLSFHRNPQASLCDHPKDRLQEVPTRHYTCPPTLLSPVNTWRTQDQSPGQFCSRVPSAPSSRIGDDFLLRWRRGGLEAFQ